MNVLVACEESQAVCLAFRRLGHKAFSCDLQECSGGHPEYHFKGNMFDVIANRGGTLENGTKHFLDSCWDLVIAHPPCTYLAVSGARWYYHPDDKKLPIEQRRPHPKFPDRAKDREDAVQFFMDVSKIGVNKLAIENPVGIMSSRWRKPDQIIEPWQFGHEASKKTCLWLKNLPFLVPTNVVGKGEVYVSKSGNKSPKWFTDIFFSGVSSEERRKLRSKTFRKRLLNYILCIRFFIEVHSIVSASRFFHMPTYLRVVIECQSRFFPFFPAFSRNCPDYFLHTSGSSSFRSLSDLGAR